MDGSTGGWIDWWMDGWMDGCMHSCMRACVRACMHACMHACMDWLVACLQACLLVCLLACLLAWITVCLLDWSMDQSTDWLIDWLIEWLSDWVIERNALKESTGMRRCRVGIDNSASWNQKQRVKQNHPSRIQCCKGQQQEVAGNKTKKTKANTHAEGYAIHFKSPDVRMDYLPESNWNDRSSPGVMPQSSLPISCGTTELQQNYPWRKWILQ